MEDAEKHHEASNMMLMMGLKDKSRELRRFKQCNMGRGLYAAKSQPLEVLLVTGWCKGLGFFFFFLTFIA